MRQFPDFKNLIDLIVQIAAVPSFSSFEERIYPLIENVVAKNLSAKIEKIPQNNILIQVPGNRKIQPIALSAHLDKINHFGSDTTSSLTIEINEDRLTGQLDDAVGIGICLTLTLCSTIYNFPPLYILLSEMEESFGLRNHPHLLKNNGASLYVRIGAERIASYLINSNKLPSLLINIDTTPFFEGEQGVALYCNHWEKNNVEASPELVRTTEVLSKYFMKAYPHIEIKNNINDYVKYGAMFNKHAVHPIPCIAIEPAIYPYHEVGESVFISDIVRVFSMLKRFLEESSFPAIINVGE